MQNTNFSTEPRKPGSISYNSILSEDFVTSNNILVDPTTEGQVGPFRNPSNGAIEALVISNSLGTTQQLLYLAQQPNSITGWSLTPVNNNGEIIAKQVIGVHNTSGGVDGFFVDMNGLLQQVSLNNGTWSYPLPVPGAPKNLGKLRVNYSPGSGSHQGTVALYAGDDDGNIFLYTFSGGHWTSITMALGGAASSWTLALTSDADWLLTIIAKYNFTFRPNNTQPVGVVKEGQLGWAQGTLSAGKVQVVAAGIDQRSYASIVFNATQMNETGDRIAFGLAHDQDSSGGHAVSWLINPQATSSYGTIAGTSFNQISVVESSNGYVNLYGIDANMNLYTLRQVSYDPNNMTSGYSPSQTFGPIFRLDTRMARMYPNPSVADTPTLIAVDADQGALHLYVMDPKTNLWLAKPIALPTVQHYEITRWQTDVTVYDTNGSPLPNQTVSIHAQSATDVIINGEYFIIDSNTSVDIKTNAIGKATIASLATTLAPPAIRLSGADIPYQQLHSPGEGVNNYLAGTDPLLGKSTFSAAVVTQMTGANTGDAESVFDAVHKMATIGQAKSGNVAAQARLNAMMSKGETLHLYRSTPHGLERHMFASAHEGQVMLAAPLLASSEFWDDVWDAGKHFAGDVWHAIEKGVHAVHSFLIDIETGIVALVVAIDGVLVRLADWVIDTVEAGLQAITSAFNWVKGKIEDVIDWLKILFDFKAIWNTKTVFARELDNLTGFLRSEVNDWSNRFEKNFFQKNKAAIDNYFDSIIAEWSGKSFNTLQGWPGMGEAPGSQSVTGNVKQSDLTSNAMSNWMQNKVTSHTPSDAPAGPAQDHDAIAKFFQALVNVGEDVLKIFVDLFQNICKLFDPHNPESFQQIVVSTFLQLVKDAIDAILDAVDLLVEALFSLAEVAINGFKAILDQELNLGFLNEVYSWVASKAGANKTKLTIRELVSLVAAFPATIIYKLIAGVDKEPFPNGKDEFSQKSEYVTHHQLGVSDETKKVFNTIAGTLTVTGGIFTAANDTLDNPPSWLGWLSKGNTGIRLVSTHPGFLDWSPMEWGSVSAAAANLMWIAPVGYFINQDYRIGEKIENKAKGMLDTAKLTDKGWGFNDLIKLGFSVFGFVCMGVTVVDLIVNPKPPLKMTADILESTVTPLSFVTMQPIKDINIEGIPVGRIAQALKVMLDLAAGVGGGALEITSAWSEPLKSIYDEDVEGGEQCLSNL